MESKITRRNLEVLSKLTIPFVAALENVLSGKYDGHDFYDTDDINITFKHHADLRDKHEELFGTRAFPNCYVLSMLVLQYTIDPVLTAQCSCWNDLLNLIDTNEVSKILSCIPFNGSCGELACMCGHLIHKTNHYRVGNYSTLLGCDCILKSDLVRLAELLRKETHMICSVCNHDKPIFTPDPPLINPDGICRWCFNEPARETARETARRLKDEEKRVKLDAKNYAIKIRIDAENERVRLCLDAAKEMRAKEEAISIQNEATAELRRVGLARQTETQIQKAATHKLLVANYTKPNSKYYVHTSFEEKTQFCRQYKPSMGNPFVGFYVSNVDIYVYLRDRHPVYLNVPFRLKDNFKKMFKLIWVSKGIFFTSRKIYDDNRGVLEEYLWENVPSEHTYP